MAAVLGGEIEERLRRGIVALALEQALAKPEFRIGGAAIGRIFLQERLEGVFSQRVVLAQHVAVAEIIGVLRRIGGRSLVADGESIPKYYDPEYKCDMEMLRFDSRQPNPKYQTLLKGIRASLLSTPIICRSEQPALSWAS